MNCMRLSLSRCVKSSVSAGGAIESDEGRRLRGSCWLGGGLNKDLCCCEGHGSMYKIVAGTLSHRCGSTLNLLTGSLTTRLIIKMA